MHDLISSPSFNTNSEAGIDNFWTEQKYHIDLQTGTMIKVFFQIHSKAIKKTGLSISTSIPIDTIAISFLAGSKI